jgi:outer membrane protein OmpA-like peptidoglycan-associated protein
MWDENLQELEEYDARMLSDASVSRDWFKPPSASGLRPIPANNPTNVEGPFLLSDAAQLSSETEANFELAHSKGIQDEMENAAQLSEEALHAAIAPENLVDEVDVKPSRADSLELDPYASIRPAMASEHANIAANEISLILGRMPATLVLHQFLHSPEMRQATLASLIGKAARRTVQVNGSDISIPAYLRLVSRLCREVAEQSEAELAENIADTGSEAERGRTALNAGNYLIKVDPLTHVVRLWLFNFDKDEAKLKPRHLEILKAAVGPVIRDGGAIQLLGLASTTGRADFDRKLGEARIRAVVNHLHANFGTKFNVTKEISFGKDMALEFKRANLPGGTADNVESGLWRAVVINVWNRGGPPPPPAGVDIPFNNSTWAENVEKAIDVVNASLAILDLFADIAELAALARFTGLGGLGVGIIGAIVGMPLIWASADALANTNGQIQGAANAIQDMADQFASDSLDNLGLSKWAPVKVPDVHLPDNPDPSASQQAWRSGQVTGRMNAVKAVLALEQHPKPFTLKDGRHIRISGRVWLRTISKAFGDNAGVKVVVIPANEELKKRGRPPFPTH